MENLSNPPPHPQGSTNSIRRRSWSPAAGAKGIPSLAVSSPRRPPKVPTGSPLRSSKARSSPLGSRPLSALTNASRTPNQERSINVVEDESVPMAVAPAQQFTNVSRAVGQPRQRLPPKEPQGTPEINFTRHLHVPVASGRPSMTEPETPADSVATSTASFCSSPSSSFMELIYSASASTTATPDVFATPTTEIFRIDTEEQHTPVIKNTNGRPGGNTAASSPSSTLQSMTPMNQHVRAEWWVPRINTNVNNKSDTNHAPPVSNKSNDNASDSMQAQASSSPFSLPSMLGAPSAEEISELDSPMLLDSQPSTEESDINSQTQSQATDINSTRTFSPAAQQLMRCDAQDEEDLDGLPIGKSNTSPTLTQLASGSALCVSREEVVAASYEFIDDTESEQSEYFTAPNSEGTLALDFSSGVIPQPNTKTHDSYARGTWAASRLFFRSSIPTPSPKTHDPYADWYASSTRDDADVSELSSHIGSTPVGEEPPIVPEVASIDHVKTSDVTDNSLTLPTDDLSSNQQEKRFGAISRCGMIIRLVIIAALALAVVIPLVVVLIHVRQKSIQNQSSMTPTTTAPTLREETASPVPIQAPAQYPTIGTSPTPARTVFPTMSPTKLPSTLTPAPAPTVLPSLPPFSAIWNESTWATATIRFGPLWSLNVSGSPLQLPVLSSLTKTDEFNALETVVRDWGESPSVNLTLENTTLPSDDCLPVLGAIRVCDGNYGTTETQFISNVYVKSREIIAVTIQINDDFADDSETSLRYHICHEIGHALGLFHSSSGCMVDKLIAADGQSSYLGPDPWSISELDRLYGTSDCLLRR